MKVHELSGGLGKDVLKMNKVVDFHTEEKMKSHSRGWMKKKSHR